MTQLLVINSSLFASQGQSTQLTEQFTAAWLQKQPDSQITVRDLAQTPVPHLDAQRVSAFFTPAESRDSTQQALVAESDALIAELQQADCVVIGVPMYNFGIPSTLKAYFDHIARAGVTFRYTENGPQGLLGPKKVYVLATRGGQYAGTAQDTQTRYVRDFLGFIGLTDVEFVYAENLNRGEANKNAALNAAQQQIAALLA